MPKTAQRKLTSEERCRKEFLTRFGPDTAWKEEPAKWAGLVIGWQACWRYLESRVAEYVQS